MDAEIIDYLRTLRMQVSHTTYKRKYWQLKPFLRYMDTRHRHILSLTRNDITEYLSQLTCSIVSKKDICRLLRDMFACMGYRENPAADITFKRDTTRQLPHIPGKAAMDNIIAGLGARDDQLSIRDRLMIELAYGTGLRRDEIRRVNIEDVSMEEMSIRVYGKGNKHRIVPVTHKTIETMREYLAIRRVSRGPLFVTVTGRRVSQRLVYFVFKKRTGMHPHQMRHACATHMLQNGCSIRVIQEILGHSDLRSTQRYTHVNKNDLSKVIENVHPRNHIVKGDITIQA